MATALRPVAHEDRLSLVEHLDELRVRLIICLVAFVVATGVCMWQNHALLDILNRPLEQTTVAARLQGPDLEQRARYEQRADDVMLQQSALSPAPAATRTTPSDARPAAQALARCQQAAAAAARAAARSARRPVTLGVGEPFMADVEGLGLRRPAALAAVDALPGVRVRPAGVLPARAPGRAPADADGAVPVHRRRRVRATSWSLPPAIRFLQNFNDDSFDILVQAQRLLQFVDHAAGRDGAAVPDPRRDPRPSRASGSSRRASCARTAATRSS